MDNDYYSIDSILTDNQKVPSEFEVEVPGLGWLQGGLDKDIKSGSKIDLPYWMSSTLALSEYDFLNLSIPTAYSTRVNNALQASSTFVKLSNLNHWWYSFGLRISDLLEDNQKLLSALKLAFSQRLIEIFDLGQYEGNSEDKSLESEFKLGMDELEKQLFQICAFSASQHKNWN